MAEQNLVAVRDEDEKAAQKLWMDFAKERVCQNAWCTEEEVEQEAMWCQQALSKVLVFTAKTIKIFA